MFISEYFCLCLYVYKNYLENFREVNKWLFLESSR